MNRKFRPYRRSYTKTEDKIGCTCSCLIVVLVLVFNFLIGGLCVNYLVNFFTGQYIPFVYAGLIGLVAGEVAVPASIAVFLLAAVNVIHPH